VRRPGSLTSRLVTSVVGVTLAVGVVAGGAGYVTINREINEAMDGALEAVARRLLPLVVIDLYRRDPAEGPVALPGSLAEEDGEEMVYQVRNASGQILLHSHDSPKTPLSAELTPGFHDDGEWRIFTLPGVNGTIFVQVAETSRVRDEETLEAVAGVLVPIAVLTPLIALLSWFILSWSMRPISDLRAEIGARTSDNLAPISTAALPLELASISKSVNSLLRRLRMALAAEREFAANAAHELRTPVAGALAQADRLIAETTDESARHRGRQIRSALSSLAKVSEKLLQLARADAGVAVSGPPVAIGPIAALVVDEFSRHPATEGRLAFADTSSGAKAAIDVDALAIVIRNLIGNALAHGTAEGQVTLDIEPGPIVRVVNDGPVVDAETLAALGRRFERGKTRSAGTGLGLAIVSAITTQVGARLILSSPVPGRAGGFEARVEFVKT
jgi:two-component system OmpR family sensor kinase